MLSHPVIFSQVLVQKEIRAWQNLWRSPSPPGQTGLPSLHKEGLLQQIGAVPSKWGFSFTLLPELLGSNIDHACICKWKIFFNYFGNYIYHFIRHHKFGPFSFIRCIVHAGMINNTHSATSTSGHTSPTPWIHRGTSNATQVDDHLESLSVQTNLHSQIRHKFSTSKVTSKDVPLYLYKRLCPSVCRYICPSVFPFVHPSSIPCFFQTRIRHIMCLISGLVGLEIWCRISAYHLPGIGVIKLSAQEKNRASQLEMLDRVFEMKEAQTFNDFNK